ncbi:MAG: hypothetical protein WA439_01100, partial [Pseudolabrys sp.]
GRAASPGEAHDTALKAAETDATKRRPFGLELYRKDKNAALASLSTLRSTAVESPPTQPRYGGKPTLAELQTKLDGVRREVRNLTVMGMDPKAATRESSSRIWSSQPELT